MNKRLLVLFSCVLSISLCAQEILHFEDFNDCGEVTWITVRDIEDEDPQDEWKCQFSYGESYMTMNSFSGTDDLDWLISPSIDVADHEDVYLNFWYENDFQGKDIRVFYSEDFDGVYSSESVADAQWNELEADLYSEEEDPYLSNFIPHRSFKVEPEENEIYFAILYEGTATESELWRIDRAEVSADYYKEINKAIINGMRCLELKTLVHNTIKNQETILYSGQEFDVWEAYFSTDRRLDDEGLDIILWDMNSDNPDGAEPYEFTIGEDQDMGMGSGEGEFYNRDHVLPRSWWGAGNEPTDTMFFDVHNLVPCDKSVNGTKSNFPIGESANPNKITENGCRFGPNSSQGYSGTVFEPIDAYKGDYARIYFYMATRYQNQMPGWEMLNEQGDDAMSGDVHFSFEPWLMDLLLKWNKEDPVSQKEIDRNNTIYTFQKNRNPFVDNALMADFIWGEYNGLQCDQVTKINELSGIPEIQALPNPNDGIFRIATELFGQAGQAMEIQVYSASGQVVAETLVSSDGKVDVSDLETGIYFVKFIGKEMLLAQAKVVIY